MSEPVPNPLLQPTPNGAAERKRSASRQALAECRPSSGTSRNARSSVRLWQPSSCTCPHSPRQAPRTARAPGSARTHNARCSMPKCKTPRRCTETRRTSECPRARKPPAIASSAGQSARRKSLLCLPCFSPKCRRTIHSTGQPASFSGGLPVNSGVSLTLAHQPLTYKLTHQ